MQPPTLIRRPTRRRRRRSVSGATYTGGGGGGGGGGGAAVAHRRRWRRRWRRGGGGGGYGASTSLSSYSGSAQPVTSTCTPPTDPHTSACAVAAEPSTGPSTAATNSPAAATSQVWRTFTPSRLRRPSPQTSALIVAAVACRGAERDQGVGRGAETRIFAHRVSEICQLSAPAYTSGASALHARPSTRSTPLWPFRSGPHRPLGKFCQRPVAALDASSTTTFDNIVDSRSELHDDVVHFRLCAPRGRARCVLRSQ